mmetsp:Transcript_28283/g.76381  ORF Transcript_28283/g.76381 Transcript_28283/m.76381 type:complete len:176 (+) Transcript_28283:661-1188(+)|eukprot:1157711-Pelagomonas_calceolata.AAC.21
MLLLLLQLLLLVVVKWRAPAAPMLPADNADGGAPNADTCTANWFAKGSASRGAWPPCEPKAVSSCPKGELGMQPRAFGKLCPRLCTDLNGILTTLAGDCKDSMGGTSLLELRAEIETWPRQPMAWPKPQLLSRMAPTATPNPLIRTPCVRPALMHSFQECVGLPPRPSPCRHLAY